MIFILCPDCRQPRRRFYETFREAVFTNPDVPRGLIRSFSHGERTWDGLPPMGYRDFCPEDHKA